ncbi:MAG: hypothetical protein ACK4K9_04240 [Bacteroidia bacterium]
MANETLLLFIQVGLALIILTMCYFVAVFYLSHKKSKFNVEEIRKNAYLNNIAIIYKSPVNEKEFIACINNLIKLNYTNFKAFFVSNNQFINHNYSGKFIIISNHTVQNAVEILKPLIPNDTDAVLVLEPKAMLNYNFLNSINHKLNQGFEVIQSKINNSVNGLSKSYIKTNDALYNFIDRKLSEQLNLPVSINSFGYTIKYSLFKSINAAYFNSDAKVLQAKLTDAKPKQGYSELAVINFNLYNNVAVVKQKWYNMKKFWANQKLGLMLLFEGLTKSNMHKIYFGLQYLRPPLVLIICLCIALAVINIFFYNRLFIFSVIAFSALSTAIFIYSLNYFSNYKKVGELS